MQAVEIAIWIGGAILLVAVVGSIYYNEHQRSLRNQHESARRAAARAARRKAELEELAG